MGVIVINGIRHDRRRGHDGCRRGVGHARIVVEPLDNRQLLLNVRRRRFDQRELLVDDRLDVLRLRTMRKLIDDGGAVRLVELVVRDRIIGGRWRRAGLGVDDVVEEVRQMVRLFALQCC